MSLVAATLAQIGKPAPVPRRPPRLSWEDTTRFTSAELAAMWAVSYRTTYKRIKQRLADGRLIPAGEKKYQTAVGHIRTAPAYRIREDQ